MKLEAVFSSLRHPIFYLTPPPASWGCRTWMLWPARPDTWKENAGPAQIAFAAVAKAIAQFEAVVVGV